MPIVELKYKRGRRLKKLAKEIAKQLPEIVAPHLNIEGRNRHDGGITPDEIIVHVSESNPIDMNVPDFEFVIWAHDFPERKANLEERKEAIGKKIEILLKDTDRTISYFVWILLPSTAFGSFQHVPKVRTDPYRAVRQMERRFSPGTRI